MLFLILSIVSSTLITVFMRISEGKSKNEISLLSMNYLSCCVLSYLFMENKTLFPRESGVSTVIYLGVIGGVLYLASFLLLKWNVRKNGVTLPATFMKLGVLVPTVLAAVIFREKLHAATVLGILLALVAILLLKEKSSEKAKNTFGLILLLAGGGMADAMSKIFEETAPQSLSNHFLFYIFFVALLLSVGLVIVKKQKYHPYDVAFGLLIGIPNYFSARFLLLSLGSVPAVIAFPSFCVATIAVVSAAGMLLFREKISRRQSIAMAIILVALVLLNI